MRTPKPFVAAAITLALVVIATAALAIPDKGPRRMTGEVLAVDGSAMSLTVREDIGDEKGASTLFLVGPESTIRIHGMKGKLGQLNPGDIVTVTYQSHEGTNQALEVQHM